KTDGIGDPACAHVFLRQALHRCHGVRMFVTQVGLSQRQRAFVLCDGPLVVARKPVADSKSLANGGLGERSPGERLGDFGCGLLNGRMVGGLASEAAFLVFGWGRGEYPASEEL